MNELKKQASTFCSGNRLKNVLKMWDFVKRVYLGRIETSRKRDGYGERVFTYIPGSHGTMYQVCW